MDLGFQMDVKLAEEGEWRPFPELQPTLEVKLRSVHSTAYTKALTRAQAENRIASQSTDRVKLALASEEIGRIAIADGAIVDWRGMIDRATGKEVPFSKDFAMQLMTDKKYVMFQRAMQIGVTQVAAPNADWAEDVAGNSGEESATSS